MGDITRLVDLAVDTPGYTIERERRGGELSGYPDIEKPTHTYITTPLIKIVEAGGEERKSNSERTQIS